MRRMLETCCTLSFEKNVNVNYDGHAYLCLVRVGLHATVYVLSTVMCVCITKHAYVKYVTTAVCKHTSMAHGYIITRQRTTQYQNHSVF